MISKSSEEYLKTMYILKQQNGNIRVTDIAKKMNCTKPSVNKAIYNLKDSGLLNYESYGTIELTEKGEDLAKKILEAYDIVYVFLSYFPETNLLWINICIFIEQFGYGFGFVGLMLFMMQQVAPGKHQMAHYAFASGIMNLGVMLPGMMSGFVSDWLGYKYFFIVTLLAMIPSFLVAYFVPFTYDDKGNKLV